MTTAIGSPFVRESIQRGLYDFLGDYLSSGNPIDLAHSVRINPYKSKLVFTLEELQAITGSSPLDSQTPLIIIAGNRGTSPNRGKCATKICVERTVYVAVNKNRLYMEPPYNDASVQVPGGVGVLTRIWDLMVQLFIQKRSQQVALGIRNALLQPDPQEGVDTTNGLHMLFGNLKFDCWIDMPAS